MLEQAFDSSPRHAPGTIRDAILNYLSLSEAPASIQNIYAAVCSAMGDGVSASSVRSYLRLNTPGIFQRAARGTYRLVAQVTQPLPFGVRKPATMPKPVFTHGRAKLFREDCLEWLAAQPQNSLHAVVTDPPYGMIEYSEEEQTKLRNGKGGV